MWRKLGEFIKKDPQTFALVVTLAIVMFGVGNVIIMHKTSTAEFCQTCHAEIVVGPRGEYHTWNMSVHSDADVSCLDCHGEPGIAGYLYAHVINGMKSLKSEILNSEETIKKNLSHYASDIVAAEHAAPQESCVFCHSDEGNKEIHRNNVMKIGPAMRHMDNFHNPEYRKKFGLADIMTDDVSVGVKPNHKKHLEAGLTCMNCHLGVAHGGKKHNLPEMKTCFTCHDEKRKEVKSIPANDDCAACHTLNKKVQEGTLVKDVEETRWYMADLSCTECHKDAFTKPNTNTCSKCHDDASYGTMMIEIQDAFMKKLNPVVEQRDKYRAKREHMHPEKLALYNEYNKLVRILEKDGSKGVHNPEYFDAIFEKVAEMEEALLHWKPAVKKEVVHEEAPKHEKKVEKKEPEFKGNPAELMEIAEGVDVINLADRHTENPKKAPVMFKHLEHAKKFACQTCHENPEEGKLKVEVGMVKGTSHVFHGELCKDCHKKSKPKGPTSCNGCHAK